MRKVPMFLKQNLFSDTIFDNDISVEQKHFFQYASILIPLNTNLDLTILLWEKIYSMENEDKSSLEIIGAPVVLAPERAKGALERLMEALSSMQEMTESKILKTFALELAVKAASNSLNTEAHEILCEQLFSSSNPSYAPNGKRIIIELEQEDLVKDL